MLSRTCAGVAENRYLECFKWARENGCLLDITDVMWQHQKRHLDILK